MGLGLLIELVGYLIEIQAGASYPHYQLLPYEVSLSDISFMTLLYSGPTILKYLRSRCIMAFHVEILECLTTLLRGIY